MSFVFQTIDFKYLKGILRFLNFFLKVKKFENSLTELQVFSCFCISLLQSQAQKSLSVLTSYLKSVSLRISSPKL